MFLQLTVLESTNRPESRGQKRRFLFQMIALYGVAFGAKRTSRELHFVVRINV
jgi:hypothetical protein